jgi:hypothetical protein
MSGPISSDARVTAPGTTRRSDYVREFNTALAPWRREPAVREFIHRTLWGSNIGIGR